GNPEVSESAQERARANGYDAVIVAPMIREDKVIGTIATLRREPVPFDEKQVALIKAFADQAVIAIENARLVNETKESLEQQTAISEILRVISSSPSDVKPVLEAVAARATQLSDASSATIYVLEGNVMRRKAVHSPG